MIEFKIKRENMLPGQRSWWDLSNFYRFLVGGFGSGKTYIGGLRCIYLSYVNQGIPGEYVSPSYKMAKKTVIPTINAIADRAGMNYRFHKSDSKYTFYDWGGEFWIGSGDDPDSLKGPNLAWAGIDEPFIQKREVFDEMDRRVRVDEAQQQELFLTGTPEQLNWGYDLITDDLFDIGLITALTKDNIHISPTYYDRLYKTYTPAQRKAFLEGKFVNLTQGRVYDQWDRFQHFIDYEIKGAEVCAGVDFNVDYMTAEIFYKGNGWVHFFDEIRLDYDSNSFELAKQLRKKYPKMINIYPDATGDFRKTSSTKTDHQIFRDKGFKLHAYPQNPKVKDRVNVVNSMIMNGNFTVQPGKCPWLVRDLERNIWKNNDIDKTEKELTHAGDAAGYPCAYLFPIVRETATMLDL